MKLKLALLALGLSSAPAFAQTEAHVGVIQGSTTVQPCFYVRNGTTCDPIGSFNKTTGVYTPAGVALLPSNNLSDLANPSTARVNLGLAPIASSGSASDLGTGILSPARLPTPTSSFLGGVLSAGAPANQFQTGISTSGAPTFARPSFTNLSGSLGCAQLPALTGDVSSSACAITIPNLSITSAKLASGAAVANIGYTPMNNTNPTFGGVLTSGTVGSGIELGSVSTASTPYVDFHSSGNATDYDVRILASGGTSTLGNGLLTIYAAGGIGILGSMNLTGDLFVTSSITTSGFVNTAQYKIGGASGVSCSGALTGAAVITNGIVVHC